ncbi:MAG: glycoside hydrolase family 57 protein [Gammaproteobacteria bacterium]
MSDKARLNVVLCWHMHQPQYRDLITGEYALPWTYLHAIKDYVDMAAIMEAIPEARAVVNFSPVMLEQLVDYAQQIEGFLKGQQVLRDPLLAALANIPQSLNTQEYTALIRACLRANKERLINRFPVYGRLAGLATRFLRDAETIVYLSGQFLDDILVWYHLAWMGETVRMQDLRIQQLIEKGQGFNHADRRLLVEVIGELVSSVIKRYRALSDAGQVELSMTPSAHPIMPLLISLDCAHDAMPYADLPLLPCYPGGEERARWHVTEGRKMFQHYFGVEPQGCWPSEGGVSADALKLLGESGFRWAASGEKVLHNSLMKSGHIDNLAHTQWLHQPYTVKNTNIECFFRDDGLSDLIGFTYSSWHSDDAVNNLVHHLENIAATCADKENHVVSIILDGENAWEYYPDNAYHFLTALYQRLSSHNGLKLTTFSDYLATTQTRRPPAELEQMVAGSWVYGTFSTWVGDAAKNHGWDMLCDAKHAFDAVVDSGRLQADELRAATEQLAVCEGSDWFWWFGDYNPTDIVSDFEKLFRLHLSNLYRLIGQPAPDYLSQVMSHGSDDPGTHTGTMRPAQHHA